MSRRVKRLSALKQFCKNGHDTRVLGRQRGGICKECHRLRQRTPKYTRAKHEHYVANREQYIARAAASKRRNGRAPLSNAAKERKRAQWLLRAYGITPEQYAKALEIQGGVCAICRKPPKAKRLAVDHDHQPPHRVRGLLDWFCNRRVLGRGREKPEIHERAAAYLRSTFDIRSIAA